MPTDLPKPLTEAQLECFRALYELTRRDGCQPGYAEIAAEVGLRTRSGVKQHLDAVERKGWIQRGGHRATRFVYTPSGYPFRGFAEVAPDPGEARVIVCETELAKGGTGPRFAMGDSAPRRRPGRRRLSEAPPESDQGDGP